MLWILRHPLHCVAGGLTCEHRSAGLDRIAREARLVRMAREAVELVRRPAQHGVRVRGRDASLTAAPDHVNEADIGELRHHEIREVLQRCFKIEGRSSSELASARKTARRSGLP
jgi:hypothetical protein